MGPLAMTSGGTGLLGAIARVVLTRQHSVFDRNVLLLVRKGPRCSAAPKKGRGSGPCPKAGPPLICMQPRCVGDENKAGAMSRSGPERQAPPGSAEGRGLPLSHDRRSPTSAGRHFIGLHASVPSASGFVENAHGPALERADAAHSLTDAASTRPGAPSRCAEKPHH